MKNFTILILLSLVALLVPAEPAQGIDEAALDALHAAAERAGSDSVVLVKDDIVIAEWYFDKKERPIELMSVLKSLVSLGVGRLVTLEMIDSVDQPVHTFYPEWNQGRKKEITIRHLLNHTSGLQNLPSAGAEIYPSPNAIKLALAAELADDPGAAFSYNNKAVNLLAGIIEKASGQRMDLFFASEVFGPMGIDIHQWYFDESGNPHAMAGLKLFARDLAKFGQLVLAKGVWDGQPLVSPEYIDAMLDQGQPYDARFGWLWWRLLDDDGNVAGYYGDGYLGQTLMVVPEHNLVAVRQVARSDEYDAETDGFRDFRNMVLQLISDRAAE